MTTKPSLSDKARLILKYLVLIIIAVYSFRLMVFRTTEPTHEPEKTETIIAQSSCGRATTYSMEPEFERALSLLLQRYQQSGSPQFNDLKNISNCLDIRYADLSSFGAEGVFYFDSSISNINQLVIEVDSRYSLTDDLTTAFLLSHELSHARQFVDEITGIRKWGCVESETDAFYSQLLFGAMLNDEEGESIITRLENGSFNSQLNQYETLLDLSWNALKTCNLLDEGTRNEKDISCYKKQLSYEITTMVTSNTFYQQQCKGEL